MKTIISIFLFIVTFSLTGCSNLSEEEQKQEILFKVYDIHDNFCNDTTLRIHENAVVPTEILDNGFQPIDGYRTVTAEFSDDIPIWRVCICTQENGEFVYRNMTYQIDIHEGEDYIVYQIPGECSDYMIFTYILEE